MPDGYVLPRSKTSLMKSKRHLLLAVLALLCIPIPAQDAASTGKPSVPEGFAIELVLAAPELRWPSAVHVHPDGTVFVSEDPMDMPGPADQPIDRIFRLRFRDDGTIERTVFAEQLYAVFGMLWLDDALYVMNMPHLTILRDRDGDGRAEEREILISDLGVTPPGADNGFNDHIVSGIQLGMDGWIYVAVGDKGVPKATGRDGSQVTLRGGGIVRLRPDGTRLEVVATGLRNILEPNLDAEDECFTYDNTDDGQGWWTRVTHIVYGGYYGYPYDYKGHPERHLPCMADFGGGSPTGGFVYRESAWPVEFHGSLFWCEWAKKKIRRFTVEPAGSSFRLASNSDFVTEGEVKEFRPIDLALSPDGRFLYIADWGFGGWQAKDVAGRLWRMRRADDTGPIGSSAKWPSADWGTEQLLEALRSDSYAERREAQRLLSARPSAVAALEGLLGHESKEPALWHGLWVRAALPEAARFAATFAKTLDQARPSVQRQFFRAFADAAPSVLQKLSPPSDPRAYRSLAEALAGAPNAKELDIPYFGDEFERAVLGELLRRKGSAFALAVEIARNARHSPAPLISLLQNAYRRDWVEIVGRAVLNEGSSKGPEEVLLEPEFRAALLAALARLAYLPEPWDGSWWGIQPSKKTPPPLSVPWDGTKVVLNTLRVALKSDHAVVRMAAIDAIVEASDTDSIAVVRGLAGEDKDPAVRTRAMSALGILRDSLAVPLALRVAESLEEPEELRAAALDTALLLGGPEVEAGLTNLLNSKTTPGTLIPSILDAAARAPSESLTKAILAHLESGDPSTRAAACRALRGRGANEANDKVLALIDDHDLEVAAEALATATSQRDLRILEKARRLASHPDLRRLAMEALASLPDPSSLDAFLLGLRSSEPSTREAARVGLRQIAFSVRQTLEERASRRELGPRVIAEIQSLYSEPLAQISWKLSGPIPKSDPAVDVNNGQNPPRTNGEGTEPQGGLLVMGHPESGFVDLDRIFGNCDHVVVYAEASITLSTRYSGRILVGSDDQVTLWIDGELRHDHQVERAFSPDQDKIDVDLLPGMHTIVLRVGQTQGDFGFGLRFTPETKGPLFETQAKERLSFADLKAFVLRGGGDADRGRSLFHDQESLLCMRCHQVGGIGIAAGPDLSDVGAKYDTNEIATSILEPSARIQEGYRESGVELDDGTVLYGLVKSESDAVLVLVDSEGLHRDLPRTNIRARWTLQHSAMPEGTTSTLSAQEFKDLVTYLATLRGS